MPEGGSPGGVEYRELKKQPEAHEYRDSMATAIKAARAYDGTERRYHELMSSLEAAEETIQTSPSVIDAPIAEQEIDLALKFAPLKPRDINDVLGLAEESRKKWLRKSVESENVENPLLIHHIDAVILPPDTDFKIERVDGSHPMDAAEFEDRVGTFLKFLERHDVYLDDVVITVGQVPEKSFRKKSYTHIEIPRLGRTVLLCDQISEATFVLKVYLDPATQWKKEQLQKNFPNDVRWVVKHSQQDWERRLEEYLFTENAWQEAPHATSPDTGPKAKKIDVRERDNFRQDIMATYTAENFLFEPFKHIRRDKIRQRGWKAILGLFGVAGEEGLQSTRLELARQIWGEAHPAILKCKEILLRTSEDWRRLVREKYTSEHWKSMSQRDRLRMEEIDGAGYYELVKKCGFEREGTITSRDHLKIGQLIWGEELFPELSKEHALAPDLWTTYTRVAANFQKSPDAVSARITKLKEQRPDWFGDFIDHRGQVVEFMSPEAEREIGESLLRIKRQTSAWENYEPEVEGRDYAEPPPGWVVLAFLTRLLDKDYKTLQLRLIPMRSQHPEWFGRYKDIVKGNTRIYISPTAVAELRLLHPEWFRDS